MDNRFSEVKLFQVKPAKVKEFEALIAKLVDEQKSQMGCIDIKYVKRSFVFDEIGLPPREITKIVKCVKYFSYWEFDNIENYTKANTWFFEHYEKEIMSFLIMPFDINCGKIID